MSGRARGRTAGKREKKADGAAATLAGMSRWIRVVARYDSSHPDVAHVVDTLERLIGRPYRTNALLVGEAGTGKEGLARALHAAMNPGGKAPFVAVNAVGRDAEALRRELVEGGLLAEADRGTLFLDEVADMPGETQLLVTRALRGGVVGTGRKAKRVTLNVIACTERDLEHMVLRHDYRHDLYYRLSRIVLRLAPLRERPADVARSAIWIGNRVLERQGVGTLVPSGEPRGPGSVVLTPGAVEALQAHAWPGNFRELESVLERALLLYCEGDELSAEHVRMALRAPHGGEPAAAGAAA